MNYIQEIKNTTGNQLGSFVKRIKKDKLFLKFIMSTTAFAPINTNIPMRLYLIRNDMDAMPTCENCGKILNRQNTKFCSRKCANIVLSKNETVNKQRSKKMSAFYKNLTIEEKNEIIEKTQKTNIERYGHVCTLHNPDIAKKKINTWKNNGYTNPNKSADVRNKIQKTCNERYGGNAPTSSKKVIKLRDENCMKKYNVKNPVQLDDIKEKMKNTYKDRTGFDYPMQNPDVVDKVRNTFFRNEGLGKHKKGYRYKCKIIDDKKFLCQGYELKYLENILLAKYDVYDIDNTISSMRKLNFVYSENHIYIPDFYIKKDNLIIEVKSEYFLNKNHDNILLKAESVVAQNYNFILAYSSNGKHFKEINIEKLREWKQ